MKRFFFFKKPIPTWKKNFSSSPNFPPSSLRIRQREEEIIDSRSLLFLTFCIALAHSQRVLLNVFPPSLFLELALSREPVYSEVSLTPVLFSGAYSLVKVRI